MDLDAEIQSQALGWASGVLLKKEEDLHEGVHDRRTHRDSIINFNDHGAKKSPGAKAAVAVIQFLV